LYAELEPVRAYYHEAQKLHLTKGGRMAQLPREDIKHPAISTAAAAGDFAALEEAARQLSALAEPPDAPTSTGRSSSPRRAGVLQG
jgi:hypothetical protein